MPWSEWVQPEDETAPAFRRMVAYGSDGVDGALIPFGTDVSFWIGSGLQWNAAQFRSGFPNRAAKPYPMNTLTEGVDYEAIPGSDPGDPYRFVDYEGDPTWLSWTWDNGPPEIQLTTGVGIPGPGFATLVGPTDFDDVDTDLSTPGLQGGGFPGKPTGGTVFDTFTGGEAWGTDLANPGDPGGTEAFTVMTEFYGDGTGDDRIYFRIPDPVAHYRPSRFRYWVPGSKLRQVHRDDGFGITPKRARGASSRNVTNRAIGYT